MPTNNSSNQEFINNADGFLIGGGTTKRTLTQQGGNVTIVGNSTGAVTYFQNLASYPYITYQDANGVTAATNFTSDYASTTTAGGTTTLTAASKRYQYFTGTATHIVTLPDATTVAVGHTFIIKNLSVSPITIRTADATTIFVMSNDSEIEFKCTDVTSVAGVWDRNVSASVLDFDSYTTALGARSITHWAPQAGATTLSNIGAAALTLQGTATLATPSVGSVRNRSRRVDILVTTAAATAIAGFRSPVLQWTVNGGGLAVNQGGFLMRCRWGNATGAATTTNRCFVGMSSIAAGTASSDVQPSTFTNFFGVGWDSADANIQFMRNAATTTTKIDLGANFVVPTTNNSATYELILFSPPNHPTTQVYYSLKNLENNNTASGIVTTNLPSSATLLGPRAFISAGGTSSVIGITLLNLYIETEY